MIYETSSFSGGIEYDFFEEAKETALDILCDWQSNETCDWNRPFNPTEEQIDRYDYMIFNYRVWVEEYNEDEGYWEEIWSPSQEELEMCSWLEWEELKERYGV